MALSYLYPNPVDDPTVNPNWLPKADMSAPPQETLANSPEHFQPTSPDAAMQPDAGGPQMAPPMAPQAAPMVPGMAPPSAPSAPGMAPPPPPQGLAPPSAPSAPPAPGAPPGPSGSGSFQDPNVRQYLMQLAGLDSAEKEAQSKYKRASIATSILEGIGGMGDAIAGHPGSSAGANEARRKGLFENTVGAVDKTRAGLEKRIGDTLKLSQEERLVDQNKRITDHQKETTDLAREDIDRKREKDTRLGKLAADEADPESPLSVEHRKQIAGMFRAGGHEAFAKQVEDSHASAHTLKTLTPSMAAMVKFDAGEVGKKEALAIKEVGLNTRLDKTEGGKNVRAREGNATKLESSAMMAHSMMKGEWTPTKVADYQNKMNKDLAGVSGRSGEMGKTVGRANAAGRAMTLIKQVETQKDGPDKRQMTELATSVASLIANGGQAAQAQIEHLIPHSGAMKIADIKEYITNAPAGGAGLDFVKRLKDTVQREAETANKQKEDMQDSLLPGHSQFRKDQPEAYNAVVDAWLKGRSAGSKPGDRVRVISPDGKTGFVPSDKLEEALKRGFKKA